MAKPHKWETEEIDGGPVGCDDFWICHVCGASGGPVMYDKDGPRPGPTMGPFLAGANLDLSKDDCDEAKQQIQDFIKSDTH